SNLASISPASVVSASRTPWSSPPTAPTPSPKPPSRSSSRGANPRTPVSISTNDLRNGMALHLPEGLVTVVEFQHVKPGKGGAFVRTKLKNYRTGAVIERTFRAEEKVPLAVIDKREMQYLYRDGNDYVFMDGESYEQVHVPATELGGAVSFLKEGDTVVLPTYQDQVVGVDLP